jgi:hypothetical protein
MSAAPAVPSPRFSAAAVEQLNRALQLYIASCDEVRVELLRLALERLCVEAHQQQLGPEKMLVAVKTVWASVPGIAQLDVERARVAFARVVEHCIHAYYGES